MKESCSHIQASIIEFCRFRQINARRLRVTTVLLAPQSLSRLVNLLQYKHNCANLSGEKENTVNFSRVHIFGEYARKGLE